MKDFTCHFVGKTGHSSERLIYKPYNFLISQRFSLVVFLISHISLHGEVEMNPITLNNI